MTTNPLESPTASPHVMTYEEMISTEPVPASEPVPAAPRGDGGPVLYVESPDEPQLDLETERLSPGQPDGGSLWRVRVASGGRQVTTGLLGQQRERVAPDEALGSGSTSASTFPAPLEAAGWRPPWLSAEFMPRVAPRELDDASALAAVGVPVPRISEQLSSGWPWTTVGRVLTGNSTDFIGRRAGSGVMVGPNLMLTASHNMFWDSPNWWIKFSPLWRNGDHPTFGSSFVSNVRGIQNVSDVNGYDYIICRLYDPIGHRCGWMGSQSFGDEDAYYDAAWTSVGYPGNFMSGQRPAVEFNIGVRDIDNDSPGLEIETVLFALHGWSGGPLWGFIDSDPRVIGIESGYEKDFLDPTRTVFAGGSHLVDLVRHGWAHWQ